jgi:polyhydroxybutyrate depolymerase
LAAGIWSREKTLSFWRRTNGCDAQDMNVVDFYHRDQSDPTTATRISSRCPQGRDVVLYRVNDGGYHMPGAFPDARFPRNVTCCSAPKPRHRRRRDDLGVLQEFP